MFAIKVDLFNNLESQNESKNISAGLPSSPIKILCKSAQGFLSFDRTNKQTSLDYNFTYVDTRLSRCLAHPFFNF